MNQQNLLRHTEAPSDAAADVNAKVTSLFPDHRDVAAVDQALEFFNRMSRQITDNYRTLESRVNQLSGELSEEARQRQQELEAKEQLAERLTTLLDALPAGVVVLDSQGCVSQCNPAAIDILGEPLLGQRWLEVIQRCFAPRRDDGHEVSLRDGRRVSIEIRTMANEPGQLILLTDLTETRQLQSQLSRAERLTSMGRMVASLAHQVRTPLSAAMLYGGHLCQPGLDEQLRLRCAQKLMARLSHLEQQVRDMLIFARGETRLAEELDLRGLKKALSQAAEAPVATRGAEIHWHVDKAAGRIICNREALVGACMNLINNALEAGGTRIDVTLGISEGRMEIRIQDNGPGFDPSHRMRIQEAFYTTKTHGTGLGLAVVGAVVEAHQGQFDLDSNGQGAVARVWLPLKSRQQK